MAPSFVSPTEQLKCMDGLENALCEDARVFRRLWPRLKNGFNRTVLSYLAESKVFQVLHDAGVDFERAPEGSVVDGALRSGPDQLHPRVVTFDVKFAQLKPISKTFDRSVRYTYLSSAKLHAHRAREIHQAELAEFYFVVFDSQPQYIALLPKAVWCRRSPSSRYDGTEALLGGVARWCQPFMVHILDIADACASMVTCSAGGSEYVNPTTKFEARGFKPRNHVWRDMILNDEYVQSLQERTQAFTDYAAAAECIIDENPLAPIFFDFFLTLKGTKQRLRVEHKDRRTMPLSGVPGSLMNGRRKRMSPFAKRRIWHVLLIDCRDGVVCITRDDSSPEWNEMGVPVSVLQEHCFQNYGQALEHIRSHAHAARLAEEIALHDVTPQEISLDLPTRVLFKEEEDEPAEQESNRSSTLPSLCSLINATCFEEGYGICLPLYWWHPYATHVFVDYRWSAADKASYRDFGGQLPRTVYDRELCQQNRTCLLLSFQDIYANFSRGSPSDMGLPLRMRGPYRKAVIGKHFIVIGRIMSPSYSEALDKRTSWCLCLPSGLTNILDCGEFLEPHAVENKSDGGHVFSDRSRTSEHINRHLFPSMPAGGALTSLGLLKEGINATRYILNIQDRTLHRQLRAILQSFGIVSIINPQSARQNRPFAAPIYHCTLRQVHQAPWDYGCM